MQTWIVLIVVVVAAAYLAWRFVRSMTVTGRGCEACGYDGDDSGCPGRGPLPEIFADLPPTEDASPQSADDNTSTHDHAKDMTQGSHGQHDEHESGH